MNFPRVAVVLCILTSATAAFGAEHAATAAAHAESALPLPFDVAERSFGELDAIPNLPLFSTSGRIGSAGVAPSLPDEPDTTIPGTQLPFYLINVGKMSITRPAGAERVSVTEPTFDAPEVSLIDASPLAGVAHRIGAQKFNTDDGSMLYDFAICYRLNKRSSVEVIPGDPAPVKLPVVTMQNNMGVTVGLVVRLARQ